MKNFRVTNYNQYSTKKENNRIVSVVDIESETITSALDEANVLAANWNRDETRDNMVINMMSCDGFFRTV